MMSCFGALQLLDRSLSSLEAGTSKAAYSVETKLGNVEDLLSYSSDILCTGVRLFCDSLLLESLRRKQDPS